MQNSAEIKILIYRNNVSVGADSISARNTQYRNIFNGRIQDAPLQNIAIM